MMHRDPNPRLAEIAVLCLAGVASVLPAQDVPPQWDIFGDFRVRYEDNTPVGNAPQYSRGVLRFRLGARYAINDLLDVGARVVTGDPGNPRTADVTIGDFMDDLQLSLDRAYVEIDRSGVFATAGKIRNPFTTTELVWDGDVNPTGLAVGLDRGPIAGFSARATGMFMIVDEVPAGSDSSMWGAQLRLARKTTDPWGVELAVAYWDYSITSLEHAEDAGDRRGNLTTPDGSAYLSDFNLADVTVALQLPGPSESYPVRLVADFVKNLGAAVNQDQGFRIDVFLGQPWTKRHFELHYGYAECETDAVLGTFSHDNLPLATNYRNHELKVSYGPLEDTSLSLTWYLFSPLRDDPRTPALEPGSYSSRIRLDLMLRF